MTGTATLTVELLDINDHAPDFREQELNFVVPQSPPNIGFEVARIEGYDMDTFENGAPFVFVWECTASQCSDFDLSVEQGTGATGILSSVKYYTRTCMIVFSAGVNGSDVAVVRTARASYSRRQLGFDAYELPLRMTDSPLSGQASQSQLRTLVLTIESTNEHQMQEEPESRMGAIAYTYLGMFDDVSCGRTYVRDEDDWDLDDKTFTCTDGCVSDDSTYFAFL